MVWFVGAGPGAPDLLTLRAARVLGEADIVVWARSLVDEAILEHAQPGAELIASDNKTFDDVLAIYRRAAEEGLNVARVHSGDPTLYGTLHEQLGACRGARAGDRDRPRRLVAVRGRRGARAGADDPRRQPVAHPHPPRAAHVDAAQRAAAGDGRPRHDDGAVPVRAAPARAAGRPDRGRLRARDARRGRLQGQLAGRDRHPLPAVRARRPDPRGQDHHAGARARRPRARRGAHGGQVARLRPRLRAPLPPPRPPRPRTSTVPEIHVLGHAAAAGAEALLAGADVVAGGRAVLERSRRRAPARSCIGKDLALDEIALRATAGSSCSPRAIPGSSGSSARSPDRRA